jgi:hypothetical protein
MPGPRQAAEGEFTSEETARRRDEVIRRMANIPPQPRVSPKAQAKAAKESDAGPGLSRPPRGRAASAKPSVQE